MIIKNEIIKRNKDIGKPITKEVELYNYASQLFSEFDSNGYIAKLKEIKQLGSIQTKKSKTYTRFDYICFQVYLFQIVRAKIPGEKLKFSLNNPVNKTEFQGLFHNISLLESKSPTIQDVLQLLIFSYNIGHFKNTFAASKAMIYILQDDELKSKFINKFESEIHKKIVDKIITEYDYTRFHLLNSLLLLFNCDEQLESVNLSINIITKYLNAEDISEKFNTIFSFFKNIRNIAFTTYDLSVAPLPIYIDFSNTSYLTNFLHESMIVYNNKENIYGTIDYLSQMLKRTVYDSNKSSIIQQTICKQICKKAKDKFGFEYLLNKYNDFLLLNQIENNPFDEKYYSQNDFYMNNMLKISFTYTKAKLVVDLCDKLNSISFVKSSWYFNKGVNEINLIVTLKTKCLNPIYTSFKVCKMLSNYMYLTRESNELYYNKNVIMVTKFFLHYLFNKNEVQLNPTIHSEICVFLKRGKKTRYDELNKLYASSTCDNLDIKHETEFMLSCLSKETKNDLSIVICSSIEIWHKEEHSIAQFDGLLIFPNRENEQIIFLEAKRKKNSPSFSKKCLKIRLEKLDIVYSPEEIKIENYDCSYKFTIK